MTDGISNNKKGFDVKCKLTNQIAHGSAVVSSLVNMLPPWFSSCASSNVSNFRSRPMGRKSTDWAAQPTNVAR